MSSIVYGHGYSPDQMERGRLELYRFKVWRYDNPQAWALIVAHALDLAAKGQPISAQALLESVRKKSFVDRFGNDTRANNSHAPIIARVLVREHPETRPFIELRRSVYDVLMGGWDD